MGMADVRAAFVNAGRGSLTLDRAGLTYQANKQVLAFTGWHADGKPFAFTSAPFDGDPYQRAQQIASNLIRDHTDKLPEPIPQECKAMPAPQPIKGLASVLRQSLADATERAAKIAVGVQDSVANLHTQMDNAEKVKGEIDAAAAEIQQAIGMDNGGPSLVPLPDMSKQ